MLSATMMGQAPGMRPYASRRATPAVKIAIHERRNIQDMQGYSEWPALVDERAAGKRGRDLSRPFLYRHQCAP